ncbi:hypothetical protein QNI16_20205 [Cytophagaceae bacterium YF14B1]|uniref:Uncharacterized protein n=1 Tax=Xanthocytophaga flava TaxID=3048013 RepID=A0AAE3QPE3_9BACT|nr:hypothetical protein [Xanthocytophaga flavus]MDJ1482835.1 hypothetical protein [Xanthocytophaga flavus]
MKRHSRYSVKAILSFLIALWVLNFSIDSPDAYVGNSRIVQSVQEDLSVNDIESFAELIVENFLGHINAIPEHDEADEHSDIQKIVDYVYIAPFFVIAPENGAEITRVLTVYQECCYPDHQPDIISPPPKSKAFSLLG